MEITRHGLPRVIERGNRLPFIVASPQCPTGEWWDADALGALVDEVEERHAVDPDRIYVTGLSMGGYGTWRLAQAQPERFAAIAPVCGGGNPTRASAIKHLPIWVFHGAKDEVVRPRESEQMVEALRAAGATEVRFTVYPEAGHDSWTVTYDNPELYEWFLAHRRRSRQ